MKSYVDSTVRNTVGKFGPTAFWEHRKKSGETIRKAINATFQKIYIDCTDLQLIQVELSNQREQALILTQITTQRKATRKFEQDASIVRSGI
jgi:hypothetical protein